MTQDLATKKEGSTDALDGGGEILQVSSDHPSPHAALIYIILIYSIYLN